MDIPQGNYSGYDIMYDGAGRITLDVSRGISHVNYNVTGTPFVVGTMTADCAVYGYTSSGAKLSETIYNGSVTTRRDYVGPCEYVDGKLVRINVPQGYIDSLGVLHAYIHDIQGNVAAVYEAKAGKKQLGAAERVLCLRWAHGGQQRPGPEPLQAYRQGACERPRHQQLRFHRKVAVPDGGKI